MTVAEVTENMHWGQPLETEWDALETMFMNGMFG